MVRFFRFSWKVLFAGLAKGSMSGLSHSVSALVWLLGWGFPGRGEGQALCTLHSGESHGGLKLPLGWRESWPPPWDPKGGMQISLSSKLCVFSSAPGPDEPRTSALSRAAWVRCLWFGDAPMAKHGAWVWQSCSYFPTDRIQSVCEFLPHVNTFMFLTFRELPGKPRKEARWGDSLWRRSMDPTSRGSWWRNEV